MSMAHMTANSGPLTLPLTSWQGLTPTVNCISGGLAARNTWAATGSVEASSQTDVSVDRKNSLIWHAKQGKLRRFLSTNRKRPFHEQKG